MFLLILLIYSIFKHAFVNCTIAWYVSKVFLLQTTYSGVLKLN